MDAHGLEPTETIPASRKLDRSAAEELAASAKRIIVAKGKRCTEWTPRDGSPEAIVDAMLGPTGNLRAPTLRAGKTVLVGFDEDAYGRILL